MATITMLGAGMMGSTLCVPMADRGHDIRLVGTHLDREIIAGLRRDRVHVKMGQALPENIRFFDCEELPEAMDGAEALCLGVSSAGVDWAGEQTAPYVRPGLPVISVTKGLRFDGESFQFLPDVLASHWPEAVRGAVHPGAVVGPCIAGELAHRVETCVAFVGRDGGTMRQLADLIRTDYYHIRPSTDLVALEVCAALKNAYALAVGFGRGINERSGRGAGSVAMHNHEAAVFAQAALEMARFVALLGGDPWAAAGLPGVGDLFVTCQGGRTSRLGRWLGLGLDLEEAIEKMAGATLEALDIIRVIDSALPVLEAGGRLGGDELPLMRHLCDMVVRGECVGVPFASFFKRLEG